MKMSRVYSADEQFIFSASDLTRFLACRHLTQLDLLAARGDIEKAHRHDPLLDIISRLGLDHETTYLQQLKNEGLSVAWIEHPQHGLDNLRAAANQTLEAMQSGADQDPGPRTGLFTNNGG